MNRKDMEGIALSVVMPCLNEALTVGICVEDALLFLRENRIMGEVLVVDNGSTDSSAAIARRHGARVVTERRRGYGRALRTGISASRGRVIVMGDCDTTYDFRHMERLVFPLLEDRYDVMIGNRFAGEMEPGAMPWLHRLGVPLLSACGRRRWKTDVRDFHCGLRGLTRRAAERMELETEGMEFATELIAEAARKDMRIGQTSVPLRRCAAPGRQPKLRTCPDGLRHFRYILHTKPNHFRKKEVK